MTDNGKLNGTPFYETVSRYLGKPVTTVQSDGEFTDTLSVFTSNSGHEGWQVGNFPDGGYVIFAPRLIERVEETLFGLTIVLGW